MENCLGRSEQFQELDKKLTKEAYKLTEEIQVDHVPIFQRWIEKKLQCIEKSKTLDAPESEYYNRRTRYHTGQQN
jgi:hypothetical protein